MAYDPKLREAMKEIVQVLNKYDCGALVSLHSLIGSEFRMHMEPTWSMIRLIDGGEKAHIKFRWKEKERMNGTAGMLCSMRDIGALFFGQADNLVKQMEQHSEIEHTPFYGGIDNSGRETPVAKVTKIFEEKSHE